MIHAKIYLTHATQKYVFLYINNHNLFLSLTIIYQIIYQFGQPTCAHPLICIYFFWIHSREQLYTHHSSVPQPLLDDFFVLVKYYQVSLGIVKPTKIHPLKHHNKKLLCVECDIFCKDSTSFPGICHLVCFIDTAHTVHNFVRTTKLISSFFEKGD